MAVFRFIASTLKARGIIRQCNCVSALEYEVTGRSAGLRPGPLKVELWLDFGLLKTEMVFPLTPALSPAERENGSPFYSYSDASISPPLNNWLPLRWGLPLRTFFR